jgi:hypothetical protein
VRRVASILVVILALVLGTAAGLAAANLTSQHGTTARGSPSPGVSPSARSTAVSSAGAGAPGPTAAATPTPSATPTPVPTPTLVEAPLDGVLVTEDVAARRPIAVMVDDLSPARPQSGFNAASVVWQAPAEGGIPRYMMVFQRTLPALVGPVRSSRYYYIAWAAEWRSVYVHAGGSPQALSTLQSKGHGQYVYNVEDFRWEGVYLWRLRTRSSPHNLYTDGTNLLKLAKAVGAPAASTQAPLWQFAPDAPVADRPLGGTIDFGYLANHIHYDYDRATNTYLRSVTKEGKQFDASTHTRVAPKNVVIMLVRFGPLNDGHPNKKRLEADLIGKGVAWISTNGRTIKGTWRKDAVTKPTLFFDSSGKPVTLTVGQTFVQVLTTGTKVTIKAGKAPGGTPTPTNPPKGDFHHPL